MIKLLAILLLIITGILLSSLPWLSAISYMTVSVLQPQYVWFWSFENFPIFKITAILSILALLLMLAKGEVDKSIYRYKQHLAMLFLGVMVNVSDFLSPFQDYYAGVSSNIVIDTFNTILIMYFVLLGILQNTQALKYAAIAIIIITGYYIYWSNSAYLSQDWGKFFNGRLNGPPQSPYADGNSLAILFVCGMPFILFGIFYFKQIYLKVILAMLLPLLWHSLLLTSSRGAFLSAGISTLFCAFLLKSKKLNVALVSAFLIVVLTQGQAVINRSFDTFDKVEQAKTEDIVVNPRLVSWGIGLQLMSKYPLIGVGPQRFQQASLVHFPGESLHVAHNLLIAVAVDFGIPAGLCMISLFWAVRQRFKAMTFSESDEDNEDLMLIKFLRNSTAAGILGFFVGAIFLNLFIFEFFYFLIILNLSTYHLYQTYQNEQTPSASTT